MRAILLFTLAAIVCIVGAWWVAALPGEVDMTVAGYHFHANTPVALTLIALLFLVLYGIVRLLVGLWRLPRVLRRSSRESRRRRGDLAVTRTLVALAADDAGAARRDAGRARRLLGDTPLTLLLAAQAALGVAAAGAETDAAAALRLAKQAWDADPALGPAALAYAERLRTSGKERIALDVLRKTWAVAPQPGLAEAYIAPQPDKLARMRAAEELAAANPSHPDTNIMLSRVALDTGLVGRARRYAEAARTAGLDGQRLYVLLADLAEVERDPDGAQEALRMIPAASPDPAWQCGNCATVHTAWHPVCDACGTPGRIRWTPMEGGHAAASPARTVRAIEGFS